MNKRATIVFGAFTFISYVLLGASLALTAETATSQPSTLTKEQRGQMANAHEKMATCLRSDRAMTECHQEMTKSCKEIKDHDCGMMMGHGEKMHHDAQRMHGQRETEGETAKKQSP